MFDTALERAKELDRHMEEYGTAIGPLHGLPVSFKDQFHVKGAETTMAYVGWVGTFEGRRDTGKEGKVESELVREMIELGAIPIAKVGYRLYPKILGNTDESSNQDESGTDALGMLSSVKRLISILIVLPVCRDG